MRDPGGTRARDGRRRISPDPGVAGDSTATPRRKRVAKPPEERLEDLLSATMWVYAERGIADATVGEITERAGVAKGTFYLYFDSKQDALGALWERYTRGLLEIAQEILDPTAPDVLAALARFIESMVDYALHHADLHTIVYRSADAAALELCRAINQQVIDHAIESLTRGIAEGRLRATDPETTVRMLYHGAHEAIHDAIAAPEPPDRDRLIAAIREVTVRAVGLAVADNHVRSS